jgi:hypothetical protein
MTQGELAAVRVPFVTGLSLVGVRVRGPNAVRIERRGPEALEAAQEDAAIGYFDRGTFRVGLEGAQKADAFVQLPHRLDVSPRAFESRVRVALDAVGAFRPGALPDDARSLAPYEHGEWRWCAVLGDLTFQRLLAHGRFERVDSAHVVTHEYRMHGTAYVVHEVPGEPDLWYALAEDRSLGARLVAPKDRVAWRLRLDVLADAMRADLGAMRPDVPLALAGIVDLGTVVLASGRLRFLYVMGEPPAGWQDAVRRACGVGVTPVLLVPAGHGGEAPGVLTIELGLAAQLGAERIGRVLGRAAEALDIAHEVQAWRLCDDEVVVEPATERVWVLGVMVPLRGRVYAFVAELAAAAGRVMPSKELGARLSTAGSPDVTARKAKAEAEKQMREGLDAAGVDVSIVERMIVTEGRRGYRFGVRVRVI